MSSLVPVSYQQLTRFLPGEKQYLILAITLYRVGTCISSMPPPSALVNTHHSYESIILSSYSLATCVLFHISSIFLICMIPVFHAIHYPDPLKAWLYYAIPTIASKYMCYLGYFQDGLGICILTHFYSAITLNPNKLIMSLYLLHLYPLPAIIPIPLLRLYMSISYQL